MMHQNAIPTTGNRLWFVLLSTVLCFSILAIWIQSYSNLVLIHFDLTANSRITSYSGELEFRLFSAGGISGSLRFANRYGVLGFYVGRMYWAKGHCWFILLPYWPGFAMTALIVVRGLLDLSRGHIAARRRLEGRCIQCGYDIRVNSGVCSECGSPTSISNTTSSIATPALSKRELDPRSVETKPIRGRLFSLFALACFGICLSSTVLWICSPKDMLISTFSNRTYRIDVDGGTCSVYYSHINGSIQNSGVLYYDGWWPVCDVPLYVISLLCAFPAAAWIQRKITMRA
jgi:hypothetical protein